MNKQLGQFMTPPKVARLIAQELGACDTAIDFSVGEGALLKAVKDRGGPRMTLIGYDLDAKILKVAAGNLENAQLRHANGLTARLNRSISGVVGVVGNPPYLDSMTEGHAWLFKAFDGIFGKLGMDRAEVQFLARSLVTARATFGRVVFLMPIGFADGDVYRKIRTLLMEQYHVVKCIEVAAGAFLDTEARTVVLVIDTKRPMNPITEICELYADCDQPKLILSAALSAGSRLDARYHKGMQKSPKNAPQLKDLLVRVDRGIFSRKAAEKLNIPTVHTTDLGRAKNQKMHVADARKKDADTGMVTVRKGDILLPRTGTRVCWKPVMVESGDAPITDHVFRIRAPRNVRDIVYKSFCHPGFDAWLEGVSKGVCATVLTKRELLQMPLFAALT